MSKKKVSKTQQINPTQELKQLYTLLRDSDKNKNSAKLKLDELKIRKRAKQKEIAIAQIVLDNNINLDTLKQVSSYSE